MKQKRAKENMSIQSSPVLQVDLQKLQIFCRCFGNWNVQKLHKIQTIIYFRRIGYMEFCGITTSDL